MENANAEAANVAHMLDAARAAVEAEGRTAERFETKARGQATLAGTWFAATQAIALASAVAHIHRRWLVVLLIGLLAQAFSLVATLRHSAGVWKVQTEEDVGPESLRAMNNDIGLSQPEFASRAIDFYCRILASARKANQSRARCFRKAWRWWWPVLGIGLVEIAVALAARL